MRKILVALCLLWAAGAASAQIWVIGDDDGYGMGIPNGADHPFNGSTANYDGRSAAEAAATDGAQFTDTYSTTHPGYGPQPGTVATFTFSGLGSGWTEGNMIFDMADFQASTFGAVAVTFNGIVQDWAFNDGFPSTRVRAFALEQAVIDAINLTGQLIVVINRNNSGDFYGFDYAALSNDLRITEVPAIPEPSTYALMMFGLAAVGFVVRRRQSQG